MKLKYQLLTDDLLSKLPARYRANFYSWMDDGDIVDEGKIVTENGEILFFLEYTAELFFHELPFKQIDPLALMAALKMWLSENDQQRCIQDEYRTPFDLTILSDDLADLSFSVKFREPIFINRVNDGEAKNLDVNTDIWTAQTLQDMQIIVGEAQQVEKAK